MRTFRVKQAFGVHFGGKMGHYSPDREPRTVTEDKLGPWADDFVSQGVIEEIHTKAEAKGKVGLVGKAPDSGHVISPTTHKRKGKTKK